MTTAPRGGGTYKTGWARRTSNMDSPLSSDHWMYPPPRSIPIAQAGKVVGRGQRSAQVHTASTCYQAKRQQVRTICLSY